MPFPDFLVLLTQKMHIHFVGLKVAATMQPHAHAIYKLICPLRGPIFSKSISYEHPNLSLTCINSKGHLKTIELCAHYSPSFKHSLRPMDDSVHMNEMK